MSDTVHPLCSLALYSGTAALIECPRSGCFLLLLEYCVTLPALNTLCRLLQCSVLPLLFCSSDSCSRLFLPVLQSKFEKGGWGGEVGSSSPSSLLALLRFQEGKPLLLRQLAKGESGESGWIRVGSGDASFSGHIRLPLPSPLLPSPPSRGGEAPELEGFH